MDKLVFSPAIDIPLALVTWVAFVWHFNIWVRYATIEGPVLLEQRLSTAIARVTALTLGIVAICWVANVGLWPFLVLLLIISLVVGLFANADLGGTNLAIFFAFILVREWAFGFPQMILHPPQQQEAESSGKSTSEMDGSVGKCISPLKPCGEAVIDGQTLSVISEDGRFIDKNTEVVVVGKRNSRVAVRVKEENEFN